MAEYFGLSDDFSIRQPTHLLRWHQTTGKLQQGFHNHGRKDGVPFSEVEWCDVPVVDPEADARRKGEADHG